MAKRGKPGAEAPVEPGPITRPVPLTDLELMGRLGGDLRDRVACEDLPGLARTAANLEELARRLARRPD
jgi:hypothetical protein